MPQDSDSKLIKKLMKQMEGDLYDPMAPDHIRWNIVHGSPADQIVAAVQWHTIHYGHPHPDFEGVQRSPYAVDGEGNLMQLGDIARFLFEQTGDRRWKDSGNSRHALDTAISQGRIRELSDEKEPRKKQLWLRAKIPEVQPANGNQSKTARKQELPPDFDAHLRTLAPEERRKFRQAYFALDTHCLNVLATLAASGRRYKENNMASLYRAAGTELRIGKKRREEMVPDLPADMFQLPDELKGII